MIDKSYCFNILYTIFLLIVMNFTIKPEETYYQLIDIAKQRSTIYYSDILQSYEIKTFPSTVTNKLVTPILAPLIQYNVEKDQPILSSLVVNKKQNLPGKGFFDTIETMFDFKISNDTDKKIVQAEELDLIWNFDWDNSEWDSDKWNEVVNRKSTKELKNSLINIDDLKSYLLGIAKTQETVTYKQVLQHFGLQLNPGSVGLLVREGLDPLINYNMEYDEPILSSLVVRKKSGIPGPGFFRKMQLSGKYEGSIQGKDAIDFHKIELNDVWSYYSQ